MSAQEIIGIVAALMLMCIGLLGSILPALPSTPIILVVGFLHRLYFGESSASNLVLGIMAGITLLSLVLDQLASMFGARKLGATWKGVVGAVVGAVIGLFFSLPGIILGPFLGALLFEWLGGRDFRESTHAGLGAMLGLLLGAVGKLACCVAMIILFVVSVLRRSALDEEMVAAFFRMSGLPMG